MSDKYLIGLTGNIATGKSIILRMLQELGATTIDADKETRRLQRRGTAVYDKIVKKFGTFVLGKDREIDRTRLANIAFNDPEAMAALERIVHPAVRKRIDLLIKKAETPVVAIEAIKLLEGGLADVCDAIWVVSVPEDIQLHRLQTKRNMTVQQALLRIDAQPAQEEKFARADVVIDNSGSVIKTWTVVKRHFEAIGRVEAGPAPEPAPAPPVAVAPVEVTRIDLANLSLRRAKHGDLGLMAGLIKTATNGAIVRNEDEMMENLFSKGYILAEYGTHLLGLAGYKTENLIAGIDDFFVVHNNLWATVGNALLQRVHELVGELSCEVSLAFVNPHLGTVAEAFFAEHGYEKKKAEDLIRMWREAAEAWYIEGSTLMVKQLLEKRIMTPL
ncbi:MAG: dephospho-CoA kinase [Anaerolineae bacterium]